MQWKKQIFKIAYKLIVSISKDNTRNDYIDELCQPNSNIDPELVSSIGWLPLVSFAQIFYLYLLNLEFVSKFI